MATQVVASLVERRVVLELVLKVRQPALGVLDDLAPRAHPNPDLRVRRACQVRLEKQTTGPVLLASPLPESVTHLAGHEPKVPLSVRVREPGVLNDRGGVAIDLVGFAEIDDKTGSLELDDEVAIAVVLGGGAREHQVQAPAASV